LLPASNDIRIKSNVHMSIDKDFLKLRGIVRTHGKYVMRKLFDDYVTGPITKKLVPSCILCGAEDNLTKEHVLPKWVFESNSNHFFITDVNELNQHYIKATLPACRRCNNELLNRIEQYIQKTLSQVDLQTRYYTPEEWDNVIRWLEIIDFKFQVWDITAKFLKHKKGKYIAALADFSIAFMRDLSVRSITSKTRLSLKRIGTKDKSKRGKSLIVGRTIKKTFHYFHKSGQFMHLELPTYNKGFFIFYEKKHRSEKAALKEAMEIIKDAYKLP
jgi:hypothetical protein